MTTWRGRKSSKRLSVAEYFRAPEREALPYQPCTGVRAYDQAQASAPPPVAHSLRCVNGFAAVLQESSMEDTEWLAPPPPDHVVLVALGDTRGALGSFSNNLMPLRARAGDAAVVPVGVASRWFAPQGGCAVLQLHFSPGLFEESVQAVAPQTRVDLPAQLCLRDDALKQLAGSIVRELRQGELAARLRIESLGLAFAVQLLRRHALVQKPAGLSTRRLRQVIEFMDAHAAEDLSVADLAAAVGLSQFHFIRAFRKATGRTPHQYLLSLRVELVKRRMREGAALAVIAKECGFSSQQHLTTAFRKLVGVTPAAWRRSLD